MIAIVNMGPHDSPDPLGERHYEVRINREVIARFKHHRGDGLAACLRKAADAVDRQRELEDLGIILKRLNQTYET